MASFAEHFVGSAFTQAGGRHAAPFEYSVVCWEAYISRHGARRWLLRVAQVDKRDRPRVPDPGRATPLRAVVGGFRRNALGAFEIRLVLVRSKFSAFELHAKGSL